jgi:hypothetical protein
MEAINQKCDTLTYLRKKDTLDLVHANFTPETPKAWCFFAAMMALFG